MERVYLSDWLYNAGIVGFLKINSDLWEFDENGNLKSKDENLLKIGDNYIEFNRDIFKGFSERHFNYAFNLYGRYDKTLQSFKDMLETVNQENLKEYSSRVSSNLFTKLKEYYPKLPKEASKDLGIFKQELSTIISILEKNRQEFLENDAKIYLGKIYGQKSFLQRTVTSGILDRFKRDFEEELLNFSNKKSKDRCVVCSRNAKDGATLDTGLSPFYGFNKNAKNFIYNFKGSHPLCEICEIIYFSYFAAFIKISKNEREVYYFVNSDTDITTLLRENLLLERILQDKTKSLTEFFTEIIINAEKQKTIYTLKNINIIEIDLSNENLPRVYSINLSRDKAEFIKKSNIRQFSRLYYKVNDVKRTLVYEIIDAILENRLSYRMSYEVLKSLLSENNGNVKNWHIQQLILLIKEFLERLGGVEMNVEEKELWFIYKKGEELAKSFRDMDAENKIPTIAYKLLNCLRVADKNQFMDILFRTYMAVDKEVPSTFVKVMQDDNTFFAIGYSFLNGLLSSENKLEV
ncbi:MAG: type I-B CRISPR-associated protein Cas8b1/Cst1 [Hydrogenothermaceae bacterium]